jgi:uncharacterized lipoprotein YddW (UPF0748 family)
LIVAAASRIRSAVTWLAIAWSMGCAPSATMAPTTGSDAIEQPMREFRAVWVATVDNIDWPSEPGLPTQQQKSEALAILDNAVALGLNAIVLQVRPHCDALYPSTLEPWSSYLTGVQGTPPSPYYDPLQLWTNEAHARGLELHAWFNPFRADHPANPSEMAPDAIALRSPELAVTLGDKGYRWLDPSRQEVHDHSLAVIRDVVERYDIDGIHLDDYFYPYPSYNDGQDFPDDMTWARYVDGGGDLNRSDWRRHHVDRFVERLYRVVKSTKPSVKVGISPFGIWRPGVPEHTDAGFDQHEMIFADARRWLHEGWVDYYAPQLYWPISQIPQSFPVLLSWWTRQNPHGRHLWPGLYTGRVRPGGWPADEVVNQVMIARGLLPDSPGHIHFSARALNGDRVGTHDDTLTTALAKGPYATPALVPASTWLDADPPPAPKLNLSVRGEAAFLSWHRSGGERPFLWVVYAQREQRGWEHHILPAGRTGLRLALALGGSDAESDQAPKGRLLQVAVSAVDRLGNLSSPQPEQLP